MAILQPQLKEHVVKIVDIAETLEIAKKEQTFSVEILPLNQFNRSVTNQKKQKTLEIECDCGKTTMKPVNTSINTDLVQELLKKRETELRTEYDSILMKQIALIRERFDFILQNEQIRASYMLREAHRERQEKIRALENQLECKNLAALMYVMCAERSRSKLEKIQIIKEYTTYIRGLQDLLAEGQHLILSLSRGYKSAARVDDEWRTKMKKLVSEFMNYIYHFAGGPPETNQFLIDLPKLLKIEATTEIDPKENPCEEEAIEEEESNDITPEKTWWERLEGDDRPFVVFGDMCDFKPSQRRQVLNTVKAAKTAPKVWKEYAFNDMFLKRSCENADVAKDVYPFYDRVSVPTNWDYLDAPEGRNGFSKMSLASRRQTAPSAEFRGADIGMGSILKIITSANTHQQPDKAALLGARDSMEISSTRLRHLSNTRSESRVNKAHSEEVIKLDIGKRHMFRFNDLIQQSKEEVEKPSQAKDTRCKKKHEDDSEECIQSTLGSVHNDSLQVLQNRKPDKDHKINYERVCPVEECQRMQVDDFMRSLPPYMTANPFIHFQQTFESYETCTPEQLEILKQRLQAKKKKEYSDEDMYCRESPLTEWNTGIATQTSVQSLTPPCTCMRSSSSVHSQVVFDVQDLIPMKLAMEAIHKECFFDDRIDFNRFRLLGQESNHNMRQEKTDSDFKQIRKQELTKILKQHPSLLDIFQANA